MTKEFEFPDVAEARLVERVNICLGSEGLGEITLTIPRRTYDSIARAARISGEKTADHLDGIARLIIFASRRSA